MFDFFKKKSGITNITLRYSLLEVTSKKFGNQEVLFDFSNRSRIQDFDNVAIILYYGYSKTQRYGLSNIT